MGRKFSAPDVHLGCPDVRGIFPPPKQISLWAALPFLTLEREFEGKMEGDVVESEAFLIQLGV